jgi:hypothetical protein
MVAMNWRVKPKAPTFDHLIIKPLNGSGFGLIMSGL